MISVKLRRTSSDERVHDEAFTAYLVAHNTDGATPSVSACVRACLCAPYVRACVVKQ